MNEHREKHSAYKSMKDAMQGKTKPTTKKNKGDLERWGKERWKNLTATYITDKDKSYPCGQKGKKQIEMNLPSVCRPSVKISDKTPKPLAQNLTKKQIEKAIEIKKKDLMIYWDQL
jgi:hypothetical protein